MFALILEARALTLGVPLQACFKLVSRTLLSFKDDERAERRKNIWSLIILIIGAEFASILHEVV